MIHSSSSKNFLSFNNYDGAMLSYLLEKKQQGFFCWLFFSSLITCSFAHPDQQQITAKKKNLRKQKNQPHFVYLCKFIFFFCSWKICSRNKLLNQFNYSVGSKRMENCNAKTMAFKHHFLFEQSEGESFVRLK